jgi:hypothetical protein
VGTHQEALQLTFIIAYAGNLAIQREAMHKKKCDPADLLKFCDHSSWLFFIALINFSISRLKSGS